MTELEQNIIGIIASAGDSKAKSFEALKKVRTGDYEAAKALIKEAAEIDIKAHKIQTELIRQEMSQDGDKPEIGLLMVHAQDHYMTSQLARDVIEELINIFEAKEGK